MFATKTSLPSDLTFASAPSVTCLITRVAAFGPAPAQEERVSARDAIVKVAAIFFLSRRRMGAIIACQISVISRLFGLSYVRLNWLFYVGDGW
jgi:hypothetical protein